MCRYVIEDAGIFQQYGGHPENVCQDIPPNVSRTTYLKWSNDADMYPLQTGVSLIRYFLLKLKTLDCSTSFPPTLCELPGIQLKSVGGERDGHPRHHLNRLEDLLHGKVILEPVA